MQSSFKGILEILHFHWMTKMPISPRLSLTCLEKLLTHRYRQIVVSFINHRFKFRLVSGIALARNSGINGLPLTSSIPGTPIYSVPPCANSRLKPRRAP